MIEWMVVKGARNLLVPSRSGASSHTASDLVTRLRNAGVRIETPQCDVSCSTELSKVLQDYTASMAHAPIKGCINSAMDLQDSIFSNMTHEQWTRTIRSKVDSSWNLHTQLPRDMDFFILLSSLVGIYGALGQSNYAAGCAFQDALARARTESDAYKGVSASLDLSWLVDAGIVAERADYRRKWETAHDFAGVEVADLLAVLDHCCDPSTTKAEGTGGQVLVGAVMPSDLATVGVDVPLPPNRALFKGFTQMLGRTGAAKFAVAQSISARFRAADSHETRREIVVGALQEKLARALGVELDEVDTERPVSTYGVDSLMAVELRNWMRNDFGVEVLVFEILVGGSVSNLGEIVATKAEETRKETERQEERVEQETNGVEDGTL